jgi:hypothetical protein
MDQESNWTDKIGIVCYDNVRVGRLLKGVRDQVRSQINIRALLLSFPHLYGDKTIEFVVLPRVDWHLPDLRPKISEMN